MHPTLTSAAMAKSLTCSDNPARNCSAGGPPRDEANPRRSSSVVTNVSSWLCSAHPAEALAQLLYEKSRLLEGDEVVAFFSSPSPLRRAFARRLLEGR